mgnify:CR=1 FL=1
MAKKQPAAKGRKLIASNPNAGRNYSIQNKLEAGLVLTGTEIKSIRNQSPNLKESYVDFTSKGKIVEAWLKNAHISPYSHGNISNHDPKRNRKLLLHTEELRRVHGAVTKKGMSVIPTQMYFIKGRAKLEIGIAKGKKLHDKRVSEKKKTAVREIAKAMKFKR